VLLSAIKPGKLTREQITALLFGTGTDEGEGGDCIFVFGGRSMVRAEKAAQLYLAGRAPRILFTGGVKGEPTRGRVPEAVRLRDHAVRSGVAEADVIVESESSVGTKDNVLRSIPVLESAIGLAAIRRLLVVSVPWHMRRCLLTLRTYAPPWFEYVWCPADYVDHQPHNWWQSAEATRYVMAEVDKLTRYVREGDLLDRDVPLPQVDQDERTQTTIRDCSDPCGQHQSIEQALSAGRAEARR